MSSPPLRIDHKVSIGIIGSSDTQNDSNNSGRGDSRTCKKHAHQTTAAVVPKLGPEPTLLSRKEVDALYDILNAVRFALDKLSREHRRKIDYIVTGGSLLGAIRQHSILFCDDDIDIAILWDNNDHDSDIYESVIMPHLQEALGEDFVYQIKPWEGGDRIRSKRINNVFLDLFVIRSYQNMEELLQVIGTKKNGKPQSQAYVQGLVDKLTAAVVHNSETALFPFWHFATRKALEMWVKEVYKEWELYPLQRDLKFGPLTGIQGPNMPVKLLKRAFGDDCFDVYYQSASHKESNKNSNTSIKSTNGDGKISDLPPLTQAGGTWEGGQKTPLLDEHYLPMQPMARAERRPTLHCKELLLEYLQEQSAQECEIMEHLHNENRCTSTGNNNNCTVYMDGVFDLFHVGHLEAIQQCAKLGNHVIIGVTGDEDATGYKRRPIVPQAERVAIVEALSMVDSVVCPCPLVVTKEFMEKMRIDLVVHGFANDADAERQNQFFEVPMKLGKFQRISYYRGLSTTDRIQSIYQLMDNQAKQYEGTSRPNPNWFGNCLAAATNNSSTIPTDPFPLHLRQVIEPHIEKARTNQKEAMDAIRQATGKMLFDDTMKIFRGNLAIERDFQIDKRNIDRLLSALSESTKYPVDTDLSRIHECSDPRAKDRLLHALTQNPTPFHEAYDDFVRKVCVPRFASLVGETCTEIYYQSFPCLRLVQPNEFSIGPHSDVAYGHHPCSVNFYVPLTKIGGASSLFLESRPGAEDWHSMDGEPGNAKHFAGAICMHWTTENKTKSTRASLDFRLLEGHMYKALKCGGSVMNGKLDIYRNSPGYYSKCVKKQLDDASVVWERTDPMCLEPPDFRVGFPWTVRSWDRFWRKELRSST
jgi:cytidyltransferase-like protein